jgi:hypothetical protein
MDAAEALGERVRKLELTMHGPMGTNGVYGRQKEHETRFDEVDKRMTALEKKFIALAMAASAGGGVIGQLVAGWVGG